MGLRFFVYGSPPYLVLAVAKVLPRDLSPCLFLDCFSEIIVQILGEFFFVFAFRLSCTAVTSSFRCLFEPCLLSRLANKRVIAWPCVKVEHGFFSSASWSASLVSGVIPSATASFREQDSQLVFTGGREGVTRA